jgi:hemoglobin
VTIPLRPSSGQGVGPEAPSAYDRMGGHDTFVRLVAAFYRGVASDEPLRALYPEEDLGPAEERLRMFLEQYFGGPSTYSEKRGHPRLRMRHAEFAVTPTQRDRWLTHMLGACDEIALAEPENTELRSYLTDAATFMLNAED